MVPINWKGSFVCKITQKRKGGFFFSEFDSFLGLSKGKSRRTEIRQKNKIFEISFFSVFFLFFFKVIILFCSFVGRVI